MPAIAILLTNNDRSAFAARHPDDGAKLIRLLQPLRPDWHFEVLRAIDGELPASPQAFDGHVLTGSPASVNDATLPWLAPLLDFIRAAHAQARPLIGLCFGHQAIAHALGGQVRRHPGGWGLGTATTHWHEQAPWMQPWQAQMQLMAAHNEQVSVPPPGARVLGGSDFCPVGAMQIGRHILTTQYHPEITLGFMQALLDLLQPELDAPTLQRARASLATPVDSQCYGQWMLQFLEHAREHP